MLGDAIVRDALALEFAECPLRCCIVSTNDGLGALRFVSGKSCQASRDSNMDHSLLR